MTDSTIAPDNTPVPALPPEKVRAGRQTCTTLAAIEAVAG